MLQCYNMKSAAEQTEHLKFESIWRKLWYSELWWSWNGNDLKKGMQQDQDFWHEAAGIRLIVTTPSIVGKVSVSFSFCLALFLTRYLALIPLYLCSDSDDANSPNTQRV